jgi:hypothetical protein
LLFDICYSLLFSHILYSLSFILLSYFVVNKFSVFLVPPNNNERSEFLVGLEIAKFHVCCATANMRARASAQCACAWAYAR